MADQQTVRAIRRVWSVVRKESRCTHLPFRMLFRRRKENRKLDMTVREMALVMLRRYANG